MERGLRQLVRAVALLSLGIYQTLMRDCFIILALAVPVMSAAMTGIARGDSAEGAWYTAITYNSGIYSATADAACQVQMEHFSPNSEYLPPIFGFPWTQCNWNTAIGDSYPAVVQFQCEHGYQAISPGRCVPDESLAYQPLPPTDDPPCAALSTTTNPSPSVGNPIDLLSGRKIEKATDFATADGRLFLSRSYASREPLIFNTMPQRRYLGSGWLFDFGPLFSLAGSSVYFSLGDGSSFNFSLNGGVYEGPGVGYPFTLEYVGPLPFNDNRLSDTATTWRLFDKDNLVTYEYVTKIRPGESSYQYGYPTSITWKGGYTWTFSYGPGNAISSITDSVGRTVTFEWITGYGGTGMAYPILVSQIGLPDGTALNYSYDAYPGLGFSGATLFDRLTRVEHVIDPNGTGSSNVLDYTQYHFEDTRYPYALTGITDGRGVRYATFGYDQRSRANSTSHSGGADAYQIAYSGPTNGEYLRTVTNPLGKQTEYRFTMPYGGARLISIDGLASTNCPSSSVDYTYSSLGVETVTDEEGRVTKYTRDSLRRPIAIETAYGTSEARMTNYGWRTDGQLDIVESPSLQTDLQYDSEGLLTAVVQMDTTATTVPYITNGDTRTWTYTYTTEGLLASTNGPLPGTGDTVQYDYDASGNLVSVTNELGHVTEITEHDDIGRPLTIEDPNGVVTELSYSPAGYLERITVDPAGADVTTTIVYDEIGQVTSVSTEEGASFTYAYDGARRLTSVTDAAGNVVRYGYDAMGNTTLSEVENASSGVVFAQSSTFDELGRLLTSVGANSATWQFEYDKASKLTQTTDPRNYEVDFAYNGLNELIQTTDEANYPVVLERDNRGEVVTHTDPRSIDTEYVYNGWGEVILETSPDIGSITYVRNELGLVTQRVDGKSHVREYSYDNAGRLTAITYPASSGENATFTYDDPTPGNFGIGKLTAFESATGVTSRAYNSLGLLASEVLDILGYVATTTYDYDDAGNLETTTYPSGRVVTINRDANGEIDGIDTQTISSDPAVTLAENIAWHPFGDIRELEFGNGLVWQPSVDLDYRLTQQKLLNGVTPLIQLSYAYGDNLNLTEVSNDLDPARDETYSYTANNMLATAEGPWGADGFAYDGVGNIISHVNDFGGFVTDNEADYSSTANHMTGIDQNGTPVRSFTYDANGNVETDTVGGVTTQYSYNHADRMYAMERGGVQLGEYYYNVNGQLVLRIVTNTIPNGWFVYLYDQDGHVIAEYDGVSADLLREYVWLGDRPIAVIEPGTTPTIYYIHTDHIGRPIAMTDSSGSLVNETTWVVFGNALSVTGSVGVDFRFPGQTYQFESGLHYNWHRQYDPTVARYTQPDPLGLVDGPSRYAYVRNDPLQRVDPSGRFAILAPLIPAIPGIVSGIAGGVTGAIAGAIIWPMITPNEGVEAGQAAGICTPTGGDEEYCHRQYDIDEAQCFKDYSYNPADLRGCRERAWENLTQCLRGLPGIPTWKDIDVDGWQPPKRPKK